MRAQHNPDATPAPERRDERGSAGRVWAVVSGIVLIVFGIVLILNNAGVLVVSFLTNWWALFILIPAVGAFVSAYEHGRRAGKIDNHVTSNIVGGLILTFVTCMFLFNLDWSVWWPVFIILAGVGALSRALIH